MLVKVNHINDQHAKVTKLDIDDLGTVISLNEIELQLPSNDDSIILTLRNSPFAAIFTEDDKEDNGSTIILANGITEQELNNEKEKIVKKVNKVK
jgi:hypothetical protein